MSKDLHLPYAINTGCVCFKNKNISAVLVLETNF